MCKIRWEVEYFMIMIYQMLKFFRRITFFIRRWSCSLFQLVNKLFFVNSSRFILDNFLFRLLIKLALNLCNIGVQQKSLSVIHDPWLAPREIISREIWERFQLIDISTVWQPKSNHRISNVPKVCGRGPGGGGHLGIFRVCMCRPGLQIGTPF